MTEQRFNELVLELSKRYFVRHDIYQDDFFIEIIDMEIDVNYQEIRNKLDSMGFIYSDMSTGFSGCHCYDDNHSQGDDLMALRFFINRNS